jgi:hypothetical protein
LLEAQFFLAAIALFGLFATLEHTGLAKLVCAWRRAIGEKTFCASHGHIHCA